jgi:oleate hydratase
MRIYDMVHATKPDGIENKKAYIIGGGIAGLSAAAFLATEAQMPAKNITVIEQLKVVGGAMDGAGSAGQGYTCRGERELEARMECLWYLCSKIPSLQTPGLTVLDETHRANVREPIYSKYRLMHKQGQLYDYTGPLMSEVDGMKMTALILTPEEKLEGLTIKDWFSPEFTKSPYWYCWSTMLAFRDHHSLIEARRYVNRFAMYAADLINLRYILHTEYNEYDSIIKPLLAWLRSMGVQFRTNTTVVDMNLDNKGVETVVSGLTLKDPSGEQHLVLTRDDLVFFTNGSLTQNYTMGDTNTVPRLNRDTKDRGCFTLWEKLAAKDPKFGNPAAFLSNTEASNFISFFPTIRDRTFIDHMEKMTGNKAGTGGATTIVDSSWKISFVIYNKYFPDQPADVNVLWAYGQCSDVPGDYVKKPMRECTGAEMMTELLYHVGLKDKIDSILKHTTISTCAMPYVTSQFMPRKVRERPKVIPEGCVNLAFMGQFVEVPGDCVFTVETSVRTAMMAVWGLTHLDKPMVPMYEPIYDMRVILKRLKLQMGQTGVTPAKLLGLLKDPNAAKLVMEALPRVPDPQI